jgi:hypothetical protein
MVERYIRRAVVLQTVSTRSLTSNPNMLKFAVNFTLSIDLSTWTTSNVAPIVALHQNGNSLLVRDASMFYDGISNMVCWYGGYPYQSSFQPSVWGFTPNNGAVSWQKIYDIGIAHATTGSTFPGFTFTTGSLWTSTPTTYYGLGGYILGYSDPAISGLGMTAVSGLVKYNFQEGLWTNSSDTGARLFDSRRSGLRLYIWQGRNHYFPRRRHSHSSGLCWRICSSTVLGYHDL